MSLLQENVALNTARPGMEEEALAQFESAARDLLRLSAAGFLAKYKRGDFHPLERNPVASAVAALIPACLQSR
ncbi:MAG TPA: hypothetical protein VHZ55_34920 [Bryobacteraceae bacterium]|nr:hypothetical protein [Bryobacteraceae bacterium]